GQKTGTMVIRVSNSKLLTEVPETVVKPTIGHADIVRTHSNFVQHVGTEVMGRIDHAILSPERRCDVEDVEERRRDDGAGHPLRTIRGRESKGGLAERCHPAETVMA